MGGVGYDVHNTLLATLIWCREGPEQMDILSLLHPTRSSWPVKRTMISGRSFLAVRMSGKKKEYKDLVLII